MQIRESFRPRYKGEDATVSVHTFTAAVKSLLDVIKMKQMLHHRLNSMDSTSLEGTTHQYILNKVAEESCQWVNDSLKY